ncbi:MAG: hypothetical protein OXN17_20315 [Candidatus Poribacteria bacterium]|nr:hypothetical protein [Candidatus Poribacteria bacterium]
MTAEVAIMNKQAIALAADSAVTIRDDKGQKIFTSASKIFTLSKYHPVGVMVYGNADIMGVPWETVIKAYRSQLDEKEFATIDKYAQDFISYLTDETLLFSEIEEEQYVINQVCGCFRLVLNKILHKLSRELDLEGKLTETQVNKIIDQTVRDNHDIWENSDLLPHAPPDLIDNLRTKYEEIIQEVKEHFYANVSDVASDHLTEIALNHLVKDSERVSYPLTSGVVIAGFGTNDVFPVLKAFLIEGRVCGFMKYKHQEEKSDEIDIENDASITPFGQDDMINTFITGVHPNYLLTLVNDLRELLTSYPEVLVDSIDKFSPREKDEWKLKLAPISEEMCSEYIARLRDHNTAFSTDSILRVVRVLPKDELAAMAESLINLTSFKRRVSMEEETVGGPIDVAVISKGDGFIWIKRKHYFERDLNQQFFANYYR